MTSDQSNSALMVRRLTAAVRAVSLYSSGHPLLARSVDELIGVCRDMLQNVEAIALGFVGEAVIVNNVRLTRTNATLSGFVRHLHERDIEKIRIRRGVPPGEIRTLVAELAAPLSAGPVGSRLGLRGVRHITVGQISVDDSDTVGIGMMAARRVYDAAVQIAEQLWEQAKAGEKPDPRGAQQIITGMSRMLKEDRTSLLALTALKRYDNYTFTHMVNVSVLAMAQAQSLDLSGSLLREFGFAALMHDIGKVHVPEEILNKPDMLTKEEFAIMKRHVIDGAHILRVTPEMPALAPIVAFEHHLKQDLSGYPEKIGHRQLNLCTMVVSIGDVYDALRSNRVYRQGLPTARVKAIMAEQNSPAFNQTLLRRFVNLMGLYPVGTLVRLNTAELAVVTAEHPTDPFRPQVRVISDRTGALTEDPFVENTWETDGRGEHRRSVVEAVDHEPLGIEPLRFLNDAVDGPSESPGAARPTAEPVPVGS